MPQLGFRDAFAKRFSEEAKKTVLFANIAQMNPSSNAYWRRTREEFVYKQSFDDTMTIMSTADEYARLINSVRVCPVSQPHFCNKTLKSTQMAFSSRIRIYHAWQNADANVRRVKQQHEANRAQGRLAQDQLSRSMAQVADVRVLYSPSSPLVY